MPSDDPDFEGTLRRFLTKIEVVSSGCWNWSGTRVRGYGVFSYADKPRKAHRWALQFLWQGGRQIPGDLDVDHLCANPICVNPLHLRACSARENLLAEHSNSFALRASRKTHCPRGHLLSGSNVKISSVWKTRSCRECQNISRRKGFSGW